MIAVLRLDVFADFAERFIRNPHRIGTHVCDQADQAFLAQFHALIEPLRDHHGALYAEAELARRILLQFAGGERWSRIAPALFAVDRADDPVGIFQSGANLFRILAVGDFDLLFALA